MCLADTKHWGKLVKDVAKELGWGYVEETTRNRNWRKWVISGTVTAVTGDSRFNHPEGLLKSSSTVFNVQLKYIFHL